MPAHPLLPGREAAGCGPRRWGFAPDVCLSDEETLPMSPKGSPGQTPRLRPGERGPHRFTVRGRCPLAPSLPAAGEAGCRSSLSPLPPAGSRTQRRTQITVSQGHSGVAAGATSEPLAGVCRARESGGPHSLPPDMLTRGPRSRRCAPHAHTGSCLRAQGSAAGRGLLRGSSGLRPSRAPSLLLVPDPRGGPHLEIGP